MKSRVEKAKRIDLKLVFKKSINSSEWEENPYNEDDLKEILIYDVVKNLNCIVREINRHHYRVMDYCHFE